MATVRTFTRAFSGGEVTSELFGRFDLSQVAQAVALLRNFEALPHGPARNRAGFEYVKEVKDSTQRVRLIPFTYNDVQTFAIEVGAGYFRWHTLGQTLLVGSTLDWDIATAYQAGEVSRWGGHNYYARVATTGEQPDVSPASWYLMPDDGTYEAPNGFTEDELFELRYTQSADVVTIVSPQQTVLELRRYGAARWVLSSVTFTPTVAPPTAVSAVATGTGATSYTYVATAVSGVDNLEESLVSGSVTVTNDLTLAGNFNSLTCTVSTDVLRVNWYKAAAGLFGFIGQAAPAGVLVDANITPDVSITPPSIEPTFGGSPLIYGTPNPQAVGYFEQRRWFANWSTFPQNVMATRSGTESNMGYHIPTVADDRISFRVATREGSEIRHIVPLQQLILMTSTGVLRVASTDGGALTGPTVSIRPVSYDGASTVTPVVAGSSALYAQSRGGRIRELSYSYNAQGYISQDICLMAPHLFDGHTIVDMTFTRAPYPMLWAVNEAGTLLGMTYVAEQRVSAWHHHDTAGSFESVCAVSEEGEDRLYAVVQRTISGVTRRFVERQRSRRLAALEDSFFVDCGATYVGDPTDTIIGLTWLEGMTVSILADGAVHPQQVVTGGAVQLQSKCSKVHVGLPYVSDLQTLPLVIAMPDYGQGRPKNLNDVHLRVRESSGVTAGPSFERMAAFKQRTNEPYGAPPRWIDDEIRIVTPNAWSPSGQVCIRQSDPLPLTVVSATLEVSIGG